MLFCCIWRNVETSCHKHFAVLSRYQQTPPLITSEVSQLTGRWSDHASYWQHLAGSSVNSTHRSQILAQNHDLCLPHLHSTPPLGGGGCRRNIAMTFDTEKLEWCGYPAVTNFWRYVYSFWQNVRTWQTHRQTDTAWPHRPRLHSIARQKQKTKPAKTGWDKRSRSTCTCKFASDSKKQ